MKIITICGSLKFKNEMMSIAEEMALKGNCILTPVYPFKENFERTDKQMELFDKTQYYPIKRLIARNLVECEKIDLIRKNFPKLVSILDDIDLTDLIEEISYIDEEGFIKECIKNEEALLPHFFVNS